MEGHQDGKSPAWVSVDSRVLGRQDNSIVNYKAPLEKPLMIVLSGSRTHDLGIYMRTPGNDVELITGLLFNEGIINGHEDIVSTQIHDDIATVLLRDINAESILPNDRPFLVTGSCGVCGRGKLHDHKMVESEETVSQHLLHEYHKTARQHQRLFYHTGGTHGATAFDVNGVMISSMEDVGRHNAMDKVTGQLVIEGKSPSVCVLSGRISYELVQKALKTGFKIVSGVGSATSLAIQVAMENDLTLISFSRGDRMTVLSAPRRVV